MKEKIIELLRKNKDVLAFEKLSEKLTFKELSLLNQYLEELKEETRICVTQNQNIYLLTPNHYRIGTLWMHPKGFGFVSDISDLEHESYFVPPVFMNGAINSDQVVYVLSCESEGRKKAEIKEVAHREKEFIIGEIVKSKDGRFLDFIPTDLAFSNFWIVIINKKDFALQENQLFKAKILEIKDRKLFVRLKKIIGVSTKAADRILAIAEEFNIRTEFHQSTINNARQVNIPVSKDVQELQRRLPNSLVAKLLVTIDGNDSKDLDDAVYVERTTKGYKLIVAIADVSYYVHPQSPLDNEALSRGNSTYLANLVLPMLPKILSDDLCSLNPNTEKFAVAAELDFDHDGNLLTKKVYETLIVSKARLTYDECNNYFQNQIWNRNLQIAKMLDIAYELNTKIGKNRTRQGMLNLELREPKVVMDKDSNVVEIKVRPMGKAEKLIENFMVSANEAVAELIFAKEWPFLYRNHAKPSEESLIEWYKTLKLFGINPKLTNKEMLDPLNLNKTLSQIDKQIVDPVKSELLHLSLLRHLDKAKYGLENIGHFGLASKCYTHFTSPIRRYSDLLVHRFLKQYLLKKDLRPKILEKNKLFIQKAALIINNTEINSVDCEREVIKVCMVEYMQDKVGQVYEGIISAVLKFGFFIQLENMVEGLVHISTLGEGLIYDEKTFTLTKPNKTFYRMGQKVKVKLIGVDIKKRAIDFVLA